MSERPEPTLDEIFDALDRGEPERAFALARAELADREEVDPVILFYAGVALLDMDRPADAIPYLREAVAADPDESEFQTRYAEALFKDLSFAEAAEAAGRALTADPKNPDAHAMRARVLERQGQLEEADLHWRKASKLDPEIYPPPVRMDRRAFEEEVKRAAELLPEEFGRRLDEVTVIVEDVPPEAILQEGGEKLDPELLGLFVGTALTEQSFAGPGGQLPPRILLFQRNLENAVIDRDELRKEIAVTLRHELGHYLGHDEDGLEEMGLA